MGYTITPASQDFTIQPSDLSFDPTEGMSTSDKVFAGMGKSVHDLGLGIGQILGLVSPQDIAQARQTDAPLMATGAGTAGNILGQVAQGMVVPAGGAATLLGKLGLAAAVNAGQSALQPVGEGESRLQNAAVGGALGTAGQGAASVLGKIVSKAVPASDALAQAADFGPLSYGQLTGGEIAKRVESWLAKLPGSKSWYNNLNDAQRAAVDQKIAGLTMNGDSGAAIGAAGQGKNFISDPEFVQSLQSLPDQFKMLPGGLAPNGALKTAAGYVGSGADIPSQAMIGGRMVDISNNPTLQALYAKAQGQGPLLPVGAQIPMNGPKGDFNNYQAIRSFLGKQAFGAQTGTPDAAAYAAMRDAFDSAGFRSLEAQGADPTMLATARTAYQVQKALDPAKIVAADGSVSYDPAKAATIIDKNFLDGSFKNLPDDVQQQLMNLANYGKQIKRPNTSGTPEGQMGRDIATGAIIGNVAENGVEGALKGLGKLAIPLYAAPWLVNQGMQAMRGGVNLPSSATVPLSQLVNLMPAALLRAVNQPTD